MLPFKISQTKTSLKIMFNQCYRIKNWEIIQHSLWFQTGFVMFNQKLITLSQNNTLEPKHVFATFDTKKQRDDEATKEICKFVSPTATQGKRTVPTTVVRCRQTIFYFFLFNFFLFFFFFSLLLWSSPQFVPCARALPRVSANVW